jgi:four helix bundle protein
MFKFERFDAWKRAIEFANELWLVSETMPKLHQFTLGDQLRRAALSIPTNIAEGSGRDFPKERAYFYGVAKGSIYECVSLLEMAKLRGIISEERRQRAYKEADELAAILTSTIHTIRKNEK